MCCFSAFCFSRYRWVCSGPGAGVAGALVPGSRPAALFQRSLLKVDKATGALVVWRGSHRCDPRRDPPEVLQVGRQPLWYRERSRNNMSCCPFNYLTPNKFVFGSQIINRFCYFVLFWWHILLEKKLKMLKKKRSNMAQLVTSSRGHSRSWLVLTTHSRGDSFFLLGRDIGSPE